MLARWKLKISECWLCGNKPLEYEYEKRFITSGPGCVNLIRFPVKCVCLKNSSCESKSMEISNFRQNVRQTSYPFSVNDNLNLTPDFKKLNFSFLTYVKRINAIWHNKYMECLECPC